MGRGDKKTKKGKMFMGSYGVSRPRKTESTSAPVVASAPKVVAPVAPKASVEAAPKAAVAPKPKAAAKPKAEN